MLAPRGWTVLADVLRLLSESSDEAPREAQDAARDSRDDAREARERKPRVDVCINPVKDETIKKTTAH